MVYVLLIENNILKIVCRNNGEKSNVIFIFCQDKVKKSESINTVEQIQVIKS